MFCELSKYVHDACWIRLSRLRDQGKNAALFERGFVMAIKHRKLLTFELDLLYDSYGIKNKPVG